MRGRERSSHLERQPGHATQLHALRGHYRAQTFSGYILHHKIGPPVRRLADVKSADHARMVNPRQRRDLLLELLFHPSLALVLLPDIQQDLDHHWRVVQLPVASEEHCADPATTQFFINQITSAERHARREGFGKCFRWDWAGAIYPLIVARENLVRRLRGFRQLIRRDYQSRSSQKTL